MARAPRKNSQNRVARITPAVETGFVSRWSKDNPSITIEEKRACSSYNKPVGALQSTVKKIRGTKQDDH
jgi:hypothetical protein